MKPQKSTAYDLNEYFSHPISHRQRQYEVVRAITVDKQAIGLVAKKFGYKVSTVYTLLRDAKARRITLFPLVSKGPQQKRTSLTTQERIIELRQQGLSSPDIHCRLLTENIKCSISTIERILKKSGFEKLHRRTDRELGKTKTNKVIPERVALLDFSKLEPFSIDCPSVGVFFFLPYILQSGIIDIVKECQLPSSNDIESTHACLSMLLLKLMGGHRLSHIGQYDQEPGLGIFAGLNILPKPTYMSTYSCRCSEDQLMDLQSKVISAFRKQYSDFYQSDYINLDFHSIPHHGNESEMEKVWCGAKGKAMKGANTVFAQDSKSNAILYTRADILRSDEAAEVKRFVD